MAEELPVLLFLLSLWREQRQQIRAIQKRKNRRRTRFFVQLLMAQQCIIFSVVRAKTQRSRYSRKIAIWCKPRSTKWWNNIVMGSFTPQDWLENFRMSKETFLFICNEL